MRGHNIGIYVHIYQYISIAQLVEHVAVTLEVSSLAEKSASENLANSVKSKSGNGYDNAEQGTIVVLCVETLHGVSKVYY